MYQYTFISRTVMQYINQVKIFIGTSRKSGGFFLDFYLFKIEHAPHFVTGECRLPKAHTSFRMAMS